MQDRKPEYLKAYQAWQVQLQALHRVLLEGQSLGPPKLKALLNREARAKKRYDRARGAVETLGGRVTSRESEPYL
jgi:hypothetical protein